MFVCACVFVKGYVSVCVSVYVCVCVCVCVCVVCLFVYTFACTFNLLMCLHNVYCARDMLHLVGTIRYTYTPEQYPTAGLGAT